MDVIEEIGVGIEVAEGRGVGYVGDGVEGEELCTVGELDGASGGRGGEVFALDEGDEGGDGAVDGGLEAAVFDARVLCRARC